MTAMAAATLYLTVGDEPERPALARERAAMSLGISRIDFSEMHKPDAWGQKGHADSKQGASGRASQGDKRLREDDEEEGKGAGKNDDCLHFPRRALEGLCRLVEVHDLHDAQVIVSADHACHDAYH